MATVRITKIFNFEMAHALLGYHGACKHIHGHSYKLHVTVKGQPIADTSSPLLGMVMDFSDLKTIVKKNIIDVFDHAFMVNEEAPYGKLLEENAPYMRIIQVHYQPTCENMVEDFARRIQQELPHEIELHCVRLYETATSYAEYYPEDNL